MKRIVALDRFPYWLRTSHENCVSQRHNPNCSSTYDNSFCPPVVSVKWWKSLSASPSGSERSSYAAFATRCISSQPVDFPQLHVTTAQQSKEQQEDGLLS